MADWNNPTLATSKVDVLAQLREQLAALGQMNFDGDTSVPVDFIRWSAANSRFEKWSGSSWVALSSSYALSVTQLNGQAASYYLNASNLNAGTVPVTRLPAASTSVPGVVQLSTATTSTSNSVAATSGAVNSVRQIAEGKANASHTHSAGDLPSASTSAPGIAQLNSSTSSTSTTQAATPSAVNGVRLIAEGKASASHTHGASDLPSASTSAPGVTQLSSSTSSTSTTQAATPSAVNSVRLIAEGKANASHTHGVSDLPTASTSAPGVVQLYSGTSSSSNSLAATAGAVKAVKDALPNAATTTTPGLVERATQAEVNAGVDSVRYVAPDTLVSYVSDELVEALGNLDAEDVGAIGAELLGDTVRAMVVPGGGGIRGPLNGVYPYLSSSSGGGNTPLGESGRRFGNSFFYRVYSTTGWTVTSDARLKVNKRPLQNELPRRVLSGLPVQWFDRIEKPSGKVVCKDSLGVMAQDLLKVCPELVDYDSELDQYGIKESGLLYMLIAEYQRMAKELDALKGVLGDAA